MKRIVLFSAIALFTSLGAKALTWTGSEDLSSINAQIVDSGTTDYVLSPINTANPINDQIAIDGSSMGLVNSFTFDSGDLLNPYLISGAAASAFQGMLDFSTVEMNDVVINGGITSTGTYGSGIQFRNTSVIHNDLIIGGSIDSAREGVYLKNTDVTGEMNLSGTINSYFQGIRFDTVTLGSFESTADITSTYALAAGVHFRNTDITGAMNISGSIDSESSGILFAGTVTIGGGLINNGSITSANSAAIVYEDTLTDSVLDYSGTGTLNGATYDIDMGDGTDTLNISNATMVSPTTNDVEYINISDSTLQLDLTEANKGAETIITTGPGTWELSVVNTVFEMNTTATGFVEGDTLTLFNVSTINSADLATLSIDFGSVGFVTNGSFSIFDNGGTDQLRYTFEAAPAAAAAFAGSSAIATQVATAADTMVLNHIAEGNPKEKRQEFAALYSDTIYDMYDKPQSQLWMQGFGLSGSYDGEVAKNLEAYDTTLAGLVAGYDYDWGGMRTGMALAYASGEIEGANNAYNIDIESVTGSLYSVVDFSQFYIESAVSYGTMTFDQGVAGSYDAETMGGLLRVGMKLRSGKVAFEPFAGFNYKNIIIDEHSDGVDTITEYNQEMLRAELGLTTAYQISLASGNALVPYVRLEGGYDLADEATLTSIDGSGIVTGNPENADLGNWVSRAATGVSFLTQDNYSISGEYEYEFRDNYQAHIGKIKGRMKF